MIHHGDSSPEMHNEDLTPDAVEDLLASGFGAPTDPELHRALGELRAMAETAPAPAVHAELAGFFDGHLTPSPEPALDLAAPVVELDEPTPVHNVRRFPMIGQLAAFLGTLGGKVCVGTTVAAASFGGAAATGVVDMDVPFFEDEPAQVETIEIDEPDAVAFFEEEIEEEPEETVDEFEAVEEEPEPEPKAIVEVDEEPEEEKEPVEEPDDIEDEEKDEVVEEPKEEPAPEPKAEEKAPVEEPKEEEHKKDEAVEEPKDEPKEESKDGSKEKTPEEEAIQAQIAALDEALHVAKDAVRAEATALIQPLEADRKVLVEALEAELEGIAAQWEPVVADLQEQLEAAETDEEYLDIQEDLEAAWAAWEAEHIAAEVAADPAIEEIDAELERIELERDEELNRLIAEFLAAVEALENQ